MWLFPTSFVYLTGYLFHINERADAFGACIAAILFGMACMAKEFEK